MKTIFFAFTVINKKVKVLRESRGLTIEELAQMARVKPLDILIVEDLKLKDVPQPLKSKISPILKGEDLDT